MSKIVNEKIYEIAKAYDIKAYLNIVKDLINYNLYENLLNKIIVKEYCYYCDNLCTNRVIYDLKNKNIKQKKINCNFNNEVTKLNYDLKGFNEEGYLKVNDYEDSYSVLQFNLELIQFNLSPFYQKEDYELYGKKVYSEHEEKLKIYIQECSNNTVKIIYEDHGETEFIKKVVEVILK